jgi:hypothetical protein
LLLGVSSVNDDIPDPGGDVGKNGNITQNKLHTITDYILRILVEHYRSPLFSAV